MATKTTRTVEENRSRNYGGSRPGSGRPSTQVEVLCGQCGATFSIRAKDKEARKYCSRACTDIARTGTPLGARMPIADRIRASVIVTESGCWEWLLARNRGGYGKAFDGFKHGRAAYKVAYEVFVGKVPEGLELDHLCENRLCVNPDHLEPVTQRVNTLRSQAVSAINARKTHCIRGHEFTVENTYVYKRPAVDPESGYKRTCKACMRIRDAARKVRTT